MERMVFRPRVIPAARNQRKFGCISLPLRRIDRQSVRLPFEIASGLLLADSPPVELSEFWIDTLGSSELDAINEVEVWITATASTERAAILDHENHQLLDEAYWFLRAFILSGPTELISQHFMLTGSISDKGSDVRQVSRLDPPLFSTGVKPPVVDENRLYQAVSLHERLRPLYDTKTHPRFKRALHSFHDATQQHHLSQRLHNFVRSIDGLFDLPQGGSRKVFVERSKVICGDGFESDAGLLYDLRSVDEHLHPLHKAFPNAEIEEDLRSIYRLCAVAEIYARELFVRVLSNPELIPHYEEDSSIKDLWTTGPPELKLLTHPAIEFSDIDFPSIDLKIRDDIASGLTLAEI